MLLLLTMTDLRNKWTRFFFFFEFNSTLPFSSRLMPKHVDETIRLYKTAGWLQEKPSLTDTLHGLVGGALTWRAADVASPTVWIQALLTFCAKIAIETRFTIVYFTFWKTQERQKGRDQTSICSVERHMCLHSVEFLKASLLWIKHIFHSSFRNLSVMELFCGQLLPTHTSEPLFFLHFFFFCVWLITARAWFQSILSLK